MTTPPKPRRPKDIPEEREITLPPRDYQPTKTETEQEIDMPGRGHQDRAKRLLPARESERGKARDRRLAVSDVTIRYNSLR